MKVSYLLFISLLIVGALFVPAVSAEIIEGQIHDVGLQSEDIPAIDSGDNQFIDIALWRLYYNPIIGLKPSSMHFLAVQFDANTLQEYTDFPNYLNYVCVLTHSGNTVANVKIEYFKGDWVPHESNPSLGKTYGSVRFTFTDWNYAYLNTLTEKATFKFEGLPTENRELMRMDGGAVQPVYDTSVLFCTHYSNKRQPASRVGHHVYFYEAEYFTNNYSISTDEYGTDIYITRIFGDDINPSKIIVSKSDKTVLYESHDYETANMGYAFPYGDLIIDIEAVYGIKYRIFGDTITPIDPEEPTVSRTGTVTMTDNNGTTIAGFEVTAVNHYTDESYSVSTDTDVAVMSLPMDRTIEIRNPQTGEYEEAPIGYYRFYGQAPGYKMLNEDGIQVSVMPEKYGSYQLCDIRVTSESGYITGKHQFQIRSRSDNSVLQTGTVGAKSATTGEWYNATVSGGIASLILPYDTSNVQSQYAGNYYVYATSPGFEDSDYGTQIVVMPHTVSEIKSILLTPIGGVPTSGNVTLRIQAFSETGTGIPNAEIFVAGVLGEGASVWNTYPASSTGYLTVSVPGNSTYDIVASGTGYYDSARRVTVFDTDPALIEIKLYLSGAPTHTVEPTTPPTGWVTPTSTQTSPPIQEDNIIGLSVKGLAKGFGIDYDTALLMFGLMIIFGAGGMVMSSVKGGAMEFIAGSIVGTFVAFALGLIPIWIFIIIAVVFGAYVLRVFLQGGQ